MTEINIKNKDGEILETIKIKHTPDRFIIYRGRLLENMAGTGYDYIQRVYLEIS